MVYALEEASGVTISCFGDLMQALRNRHDFFASRLSDRGVDTLWAGDCTEAEATAIFAKASTGAPVTPPEVAAYRSFMLHELAIMDAEKGWTMQIHYGALRGANSRMKALLGADCGFDSIGDQPEAAALARHLDRLDLVGKLPKTIIYNLNSRDNDLVNFATQSKAGAFFTVGFIDVSCPPSSVYAAYNAVSGKKDIVNYFYSGHISTPEADAAVKRAILSYLKSAKSGTN